MARKFQRNRSISHGYGDRSKLLFLRKFQRNRSVENSKWLPFLGRGNFFLKIAKTTLLRYPLGRKFRRNRSISHGLGDRHIYVFCYVAITREVKAITINDNTKQVIDPINLHTKFYKDELKYVSFKSENRNAIQSRLKVAKQLLLR